MDWFFLRRSDAGHRVPGRSRSSPSFGVQSVGSGRPDREVEIFQLAVLDHHPDACRGGDPGFCSSEEKGGKMRKGGKKVTERTSQQVVEPATQS